MAVFTPTERKILQILSDGKSHTRLELHVCLQDELAKLTAVQFHISMIRAKLRPNGEDIVCESPRLTYRHVRMLSSANNGYK